MGETRREVGVETYSILRLCADDPENDTTALQLIERAKHPSDRQSYDISELEIAQYYIRRAENRISTAATVLPLR